MIITGMAHFESVCKKKLVDWYHKNKPGVEIDLSNVFVVWLVRPCRTTSALLLPLSVGTAFTLSTPTTAISRNSMRMCTANLTNTCITEE